MHVWIQKQDLISTCFIIVPSHVCVRPESGRMMQKSIIVLQNGGIWTRNVSESRPVQTFLAIVQKSRTSPSWKNILLFVSSRIYISSVFIDDLGLWGISKDSYKLLRFQEDKMMSGRYDDEWQVAGRIVRNDCDCGRSFAENRSSVSVWKFRFSAYEISAEAHGGVQLRVS